MSRPRTGTAPPGRAACGRGPRAWPRPPRTPRTPGGAAGGAVVTIVETFPFGPVPPPDPLPPLGARGVDPVPDLSPAPDRLSPMGCKDIFPTEVLLPAVTPRVTILSCGSEEASVLIFEGISATLSRSPPSSVFVDSCGLMSIRVEMSPLCFIFEEVAFIFRERHITVHAPPFLSVSG